MKLQEKQIFFLICITLVITTLIAYEPIRHNGFVLIDDPYYVAENPNVNAGLTLDSVIWAFTGSHCANWHPLTSLSHILDCEIFGLNPLGHHAINLVLHIVNSLLLFLLMTRMTGRIWASAFVAAAFALHPVHVESVAWVSERKDVLSGLFWMLTILAYIHYVKRPGAVRFMLVLLAFILGLMSKPMLVTLPFVLLLLDFWPLGRIQWEDVSIRKITPLGRLLIEKTPLFVLSAISSVITFLVQKQSLAIVGLERWPFTIRLINAIGCYYNYVVKMVYPKDLAVLYPFPAKPSTDTAALAIMGVAVLLVLWGKGRKWLVVGLLWYLGTLVPVIGLVQVGGQIMADRYTYLPLIGLFIIAAWGADEIFTKKQYPKWILTVAAVAAIIAMTLITRIQVGYWRNTETLFKHTLAITQNNYIILDGLGQYLCKQGKYEEGIPYFKEAVDIKPDYIPASDNICVALLAQNKYDEAITCLTEQIEKEKYWPELYKTHFNLGMAYARKGNLSEAESNFRKALELNPNCAPARENLEALQASRGKTP